MRAQPKVLTAIVGSYPKPRYVYPQNGRSLLDSFGFAFDRHAAAAGSDEHGLERAVAAPELDERQGREALLGRCAADVEREAAGGADRVVNDFRARLDKSSVWGAGARVRA